MHRIWRNLRCVDMCTYCKRSKFLKQLTLIHSDLELHRWRKANDLSLWSQESQHPISSQFNHHENGAPCTNTTTQPPPRQSIANILGFFNSFDVFIWRRNEYVIFEITTLWIELFFRTARIFSLDSGDLYCFLFVLLGPPICIVCLQTKLKNYSVLENGFIGCGMKGPPTRQIVGKKFQIEFGRRMTCDLRWLRVGVWGKSWFG